MFQKICEKGTNFSLVSQLYDSFASSFDLMRQITPFHDGKKVKRRLSINSSKSSLSFFFCIILFVLCRYHVVLGMIRVTCFTFFLQWNIFTLIALLRNWAKSSPIRERIFNKNNVSESFKFLGFVSKRRRRFRERLEPMTERRWIGNEIHKNELSKNGMWCSSMCYDILVM